MADSFKHIFLKEVVQREKYRTPPSRGTKPKIPFRDRETQTKKLLAQFDEIWKEKERMQLQRGAEKIATREGTYLSFSSAINHDLITKSLEDNKKGIRLLNIKESLYDDNQKQIIATVYVPKGKEGHFIAKIQKYNCQETISNKPKNAPLVNSIEDVRVALLEGLWTSKLNLMPDNVAKWCEVWLNVDADKNKEKNQVQFFYKILSENGIEYKPNKINFPERTVLLIKANREQLVELMMQSDILAEFRTSQEPAGFWVNENASDQQIWVDDLLQRIELIDSKIKVCLLDSGVNNGHQLLQPLIDDLNCITVDSAWGTNDHSSQRGGHGTLMAGLACYSVLEDSLLSKDKVYLTHKLCSVKILPRPNQKETHKELWGDVVMQGIARAEIQNPNIVMIYCLSVTSTEDVDRGRPSSWSGAIDKIAFGEGILQRLLIISAGNISDDESWKNYPISNFTSSVHNPAQSWNAIVVGSYTEKTQVNDDNYQNYITIAKEGELSPYSSTSLVWEKKWPIKPDVVFEGGNLLKNTNNEISSHEDLELLSTSKSFNIKPLDTINATSASAAQASWFAAKIAYEYPNAWAETVRGLMVHSANWNDAMFSQMNVVKGNRTSYKDMMRVYGYGVPYLEKALYSKESAFTFIAQETIQPFNFKDGNKSQAETNEIHFFNLPWPSELMLSMGEIPIKFRITLSYFIEPGAGEIGWKDKYRYQSHGLRFDVNNINENEEVFRKRVNIAAREENEVVSNNSGSNRWIIGSNNRSNGSIHSDFMELTAAELSNCNLIAVYPVIGWWRERKHLGKVANKTRYSLIVSIETPVQDIELYTTVKNLIEIPISINTI